MWEKGGPSPNPKGRPRADKEFEKLCQAMSAKALQRISEMLENPDIDSPNLMKAIQFLADRGYGKPKQKIEHSGSADIANAAMAVETAQIEDDE